MKLAGYTVRFMHDNFARTTVCSISRGEQHVIARAICSEKDNFCRKSGRKVSLAKALLSTEKDKNVRRQAWNDYFAICKY